MGDAWKERFTGLYEQGLSDAAIAEECGISTSSVQTYRESLKLKGNGHRGNNQSLRKRPYDPRKIHRIFKMPWIQEEAHD